MRRLMRTRWANVAVAAVAIVVLAGCTAAPESGPTEKPIAKPTVAVDSPATMCGDGYSTPPIAPTSTLWLPADGSWFHTGVIGDAAETTVAVFVHQADTGFCGWYPYAQYLAKRGVRSILLNLCGYGVTLCPPDALVLSDGADAVLVAARWARAHGATRVVVVGASMGGTTAVLAASEDHKHGLDAVADLSGPLIYLDANISNAGSEITVPSFFAVDPSDPVVSPAAMEGLASEIASPAPILHLDGSGHGWDLLHGLDRGAFNPLGEQLAEFIQGSPAG